MATIPHVPSCYGFRSVPSSPFAQHRLHTDETYILRYPTISHRLPLRPGYGRQTWSSAQFAIYIFQALRWRSRVDQCRRLAGIHNTSHARASAATPQFATFWKAIPAKSFPSSNPPPSQGCKRRERSLRRLRRLWEAPERIWRWRCTWRRMEADTRISRGR